VGPRAGLDGYEKSGPPPEFDPRTVQPVASRYTDLKTRTCFAALMHHLQGVLLLYQSYMLVKMQSISRLRLKCDGTCAETRFRLSAKRMTDDSI
jgi:hypothetical protein